MLSSDYNNRRLIIHTRGFTPDTDATKRAVIENHMQFYGALCESFVPIVVTIHMARVPIVRYFHKYLDISVDISLLGMYVQ